MTDDLKPLIQKLRGLVEKATQGERYSDSGAYSDGGGYEGVHVFCDLDTEFPRLSKIGEFETNEDDQLAAACDVPTITRLLDAAEGERAAADVAVWAQTAVAAWQKWKLSPHDILAEQDLNRAMASLRDSLATKTLAASKAKEEEKE